MFLRYHTNKNLGRLDIQMAGQMDRQLKNIMPPPPTGKGIKNIMKCLGSLSPKNREKKYLFEVQLTRLENIICSRCLYNTE